MLVVVAHHRRIGGVCVPKLEAARRTEWQRLGVLDGEGVTIVREPLEDVARLLARRLVRETDEGVLFARHLVDVGVGAFRNLHELLEMGALHAPQAPLHTQAEERDIVENTLMNGAHVDSHIPARLPIGRRTESSHLLP